VLPDIGEQEQHQQSTALRVDIGAPRHEVRRLSAEADIDVPTGVAGIGERGEPHGEGTHRLRSTPAALSDQLIERGVQPWRVSRLDERGLGKHAQSNDGLRPCRGIVRAAPRRLPENRLSRVRALARERVVDACESVADELLNLRRLEPARYGRDVVHECPHRTSVTVS